jgi:superfamily II DNA or RNA helicase
MNVSVIICYEPNSWSEYLQCVGRGNRTTTGKSKGEAIIIAVSDEHLNPNDYKQKMIQEDEHVSKTISHKVSIAA